MMGDASLPGRANVEGLGLDRTLVVAARSGDEEAFASIARGSADRLFAVAHRILRDVGRAEDAVQQTLVTAWRQLPELRDADRFDAWIHRILVHACYAEARVAQRWSANVRLLSVDGPATPDTTLDVATRDALDRAFRRIPPEQRAVFVLHHYLGWPLVEIAESLGVPLGTVKSRLHYATAALRAGLEADARATTPASRERMA
jgi:RNA polymerase sigma-70 factor (ECF subfamily)